MNEKRFKNMREVDDYLEKQIQNERFTGKLLTNSNGEEFGFTIYDEDKRMNIDEVVGVLNEQQALITTLQGEVNRLQYIIDELRKDNYKRFEKINELKAKLKEKEEDEQLYANEIVKLNKEAKEVLDFKSLGGDY